MIPLIEFVSPLHELAPRLTCHAILLGGSARGASCGNDPIKSAHPPQGGGLQHAHSTARRPPSVLILIAPEVDRPSVISAFLRGDPLQRAVHRAEDMGSAARSGGDFEFALRVPSCACGGLDERRVGIESCKHKILIQISCADLVWIATVCGVASLLCRLLE